MSKKYMHLGSIYERYSDNKVKMSEKYRYLDRENDKVTFIMMREKHSNYFIKHSTRLI